MIITMNNPRATIVLSNENCLALFVFKLIRHEALPVSSDGMNKSRFRGLSLKKLTEFILCHTNIVRSHNSLLERLGPTLLFPFFLPPFTNTHRMLPFNYEIIRIHDIN